LSKNLESLKPGYDVVVVGSGYGGGVAASRLARCGLGVCVLERGREILTGEFPDRMSRAIKDFQITGDNINFGSSQGLFDIRVGDDIHVLQGCGLGGTSLINANVCLKPDPRVFEDPVWPEDIRKDDSLTLGFARAREMLRPTMFKDQYSLLKLRALDTASDALGTHMVCPPLHVTFRERVNAANIIQPACTLCGDCCSGCNVGAKTTVNLTYLPDAVAHGAEIFSGIKVRSLSKHNEGGWQIYYEINGSQGSNEIAPNGQIDCKILILAAGSLGTCEILLRSAEQGLALSNKLGKRFTGNGDVLAIGYNNDVDVNSVGIGFPPKVNGEPVGPAVAGLIDLRQTENVDDGVAIVDASIPSSMATGLASILAGADAAFGVDGDHTLADELDEFGRALKGLVNGAYSGAVRNTQSFLAIGHDQCSGELFLENDQIKINWPNAARQEVFRRIDDALTRAVAATGGTYIRNPLSETVLGENLLTVHPLGGAPMGESHENGVVNHKGEVFDPGNSEIQNALHDGLYICDGSIMPRSLGIHPLFTITAMAERILMHLYRDRSFIYVDTTTDELA